MRRRYDRKRESGVTTRERPSLERESENLGVAELVREKSLKVDRLIKDEVLKNWTNSGSSKKIIDVSS